MKMKKAERIKSALKGESVDRPPVSIWMHFPAVDQDALTLSKIQVNFQRKYDYDFIKLMPFGLYSAQDWGCQVQFYCDDIRSPVVYKHGIGDAKEWRNIKPLPPIFGNWGQQLRLAEYTVSQVGREIPVLQTIFSPLTTAYKLAGDRLIRDIRESPEWIHQALKAITETTKASIIENAKAGTAGIFFATQCATNDLFTIDEYNDFGKPYDLELLRIANETGLWFNILHIHGEHIMFEELLDYPVHAFNWHDRQVSPTLREARDLTDRCLIGGLNEKGAISSGTSDEVVREVCQAISEAGVKKLMIGPGCVTDPKPPEANLYAARMAVEPGMCESSLA
jgi:uroporphyrinogen decarboxylase